MSNSNNLIVNSFEILKTQAEELYLLDYVPVVDGVPDPLVFYREWVTPNLPVVFRGGAKRFPAVTKWTPEYLKSKHGENIVTVAVTPNGYADAISEDEKYFMLPEEKQMKFKDFIDILHGNCDNVNSRVLYMQQQNSNLTKEMRDLINDVPNDIHWATKAFGEPPDAVNFWMGDSRAITSTHKDPYENLYCVISGEKIFELTPPTDLPGMPYRTYPVAKYSNVESRLEYDIIEMKDMDPVKWISPYVNDTPIKPRSISVNVLAGDILYLPSLWFHKVMQSHGCVAVNYWYDMKFDIKYAYYSMLEKLTNKF